MATLTREQFKQRFGDAGLNRFSPQAQPQQSRAAETFQDIRQTGRNIFSRFGTARQESQQIKESGDRFLSQQIQQVGVGGKALSGVFGDLITGAVKGVLSQEQEEKVKSGVATGAEKVLGNEFIATTIDDNIKAFQKLDPETQRNLQALFNIGMATADAAGLGLAGKGARVGKEALEEVGERVIKKGIDVTGDISQRARPVIEGVGDIATRTQRAVSNIPTKVSTNLAEKRIATRAIESLPTEVAKKTASLGVDVQDVNTLLRIQNKAKLEVRELLDSVKDFASGTSKVRPEEVVGKPILRAVEQLESQRNSIGKQLGEVSKDLGIVSRSELVDPVFNKLKSVIKGLELKDGKLNFKNTVLTTKETLADRKAIQSIFEQSTKWGSGSKKHKLRQELFEILGGKKKSLSNMTGTQEKAFNAVRQALSDVLDTKNPAYKRLNAEYVKFNNPLLDLNKMMRGVEGADEEIVSMLAGLLTRRLTSNTTSGVKFRKILSDIDKALQGETLSSLEDLQDVYNVLDKYYDIAGKTSFKGLIKSSIPEGKDLTSRAFDAATGLTKETPAVRQKAIEDLLLNILQ